MADRAAVVTALVLRGDARALPLPDASVDLIVTSPPYYGLREYRDGGETMPGQLGLEGDPLAYIDALLEVTGECLRVLRPGGSLFVNLGDRRSDRAGGRDNRPEAVGGVNVHGRRQRPTRANTTRIAPRGSRLMLPERYAIGCVDEFGLSVRQRIIWAKPSGLPESVKDRCVDKHETLLHLVRPGPYYSAVDLLRRPHAEVSIRRAAPHRAPTGVLYADHPDGKSKRMRPEETCHPLGALPGDVWEIPTQPLFVPEHLGVDHFAAFPPELARRCIIGWSPERRCLTCGEAVRPVVDRPVYGDWNDGATRSGRMVNGRGMNSRDRNREWRRRVREGLLPRVVGEECACTDGPGETAPGADLRPVRWHGHDGACRERPRPGRRDGRPVHRLLPYR